MTTNISAPPEAALAALGFTDTEAAAYCALLRGGASTGYRLAQTIGKATANTYQSLAALTQKGAVLPDDGEAKTYRAVPPEELLSALRQGFEARRAEARAALDSIQPPPADDRLYHLKTSAQAFEKACSMVAHAREVLLFDLFPEPLAALAPDLAAAAARGVQVAGIVYAPAEDLGFTAILSPAHAFAVRRWPGRQLTLVADAREHLVALLSGDGDLRHGVWSDSPYLACLQHSGLSAEIRLMAAAPAGADPLARLSLLRAAPAGLRRLVGAADAAPLDLVPGDAA
jgi:sugar-specific transcriptional regulator TrmB